MRARRAGGLLAAALAAVLLAAGCASVPTEGQIRSGSKNAAAASNSRVGVQAQGPRTDAKPMSLVSGFLEAMSDFSGYDTAREYMTPEAAAQWRPETKISVFDQSSTKTLTMLPGGNTIRLKAPLVGTIDQRGSWSSARRGVLVQFDFKLVQADGQYRVSSTPLGVFLGSNQLESRLQPYALYFTNPERSLLVPDPIFLPDQLPPGQTATRLVQELLKGPTTRLGNGVGTAAPSGTEVSVSVPVELGEATVELRTSGAGLSDQDRNLLAAQIMWTLRPISTRVKITIDGGPLVDNTTDALQFSDYAQFDPTVPIPQMKELYGVLNRKIVRVNLDSATMIGVVRLDESLIYKYDVDSFAVNLRGSLGAVETLDDGQQVVAIGPLAQANDDDKVDLVPTEGTVLRPSFDNQDNLWILDRAGSPAPRLRMRAKDGKITPVRTDFKGRTPVQLRMAPDGVRALMVLRDPANQNSVETGTITTDDAKQLQLTQNLKLEVPLVDITDATWHQLGILVAGRPDRNASREPWLVNVDGSAPRVMPGGPNNDFQAEQLASNPNIDTLPVVKDTDGITHWQSKDLNWSELQDDQPIKITPLYPG